jgi:predicted transcriptional regulator
MDILNTLRAAGGPLDDDQLAGVLGTDRRSVTRECRRLAFAGCLIREQSSQGGIVNRLDDFAFVPARRWTRDLATSVG